MRDRKKKKTVRVSVSTGGTQGNDISYLPAITPDGRFVAFNSYATNLVDGDTNKWADIFVRDRWNKKTVRSSISTAGMQGDRQS